MNLERFGFINPEKKNLRSRLDEALEQVLKRRGIYSDEKKEDEFLSLFKELAATDVNLGIEYLSKTSNKRDGARFFGKLEGRMFAFIAGYDPDLAMKVFKKEYTFPRKDNQEIIERCWKRDIIRPENAEMILSHLSTHSPNSDLVSIFEDSDIIKVLCENAVLNAFSTHNAERIFELAPEIDYEKINNNVSELITKTALERLQVKKEEIGKKEKYKLLQNGLIARLSWSVDEINELNFELDTHLQVVLDTMSDEEIWELSTQSSGAVKHTLEEEVVLRIAAKDPEKIFLDPYKDVIKRSGIKTLLYGIIKDSSVLERMGDRPQNINYGNKCLFDVTATRHFDIAAEAAMVLSTTGINVKDTWVGTKEMEVNRGLYYAKKHLERFPQNGADVFEALLVNYDKFFSYKINDKSMIKRFVQEYPKRAIEILKHPLDVGLRRCIFQGFPESSLGLVVSELHNNYPDFFVKDIQEYIPYEVMGKHLREMPPEFVERYFGLTLNMDGPNDLSLFWEGLSSDHPSLGILHDQLKKQFKEDQVLSLERLFISPALTSIRSLMIQNDMRHVVKILTRMVVNGVPSIQERLDNLAQTMQVFKHSYETIGKKSGMSLWVWFQNVFLETIEKGEGERVRLMEIFSDPRVNVVAHEWGESITTSLLSRLIDEKNLPDQEYEVLKDERLTTIRMRLKNETVKDIISLFYSDSFTQMRNELFDLFSNNSLETILHTFPWYEKNLVRSIRKQEVVSVVSLLRLVESNASKEEWLVHILNNQGAQYQNDIVNDFQKYDVKKLAHHMFNADLSWKIIAKLPTESIEDFKKELLESILRKDSNGEMEFGAKIVASAMKKIIGSPDQYAMGIERIHKLAQLLGNTGVNLSLHEQREEKENSVNLILDAFEQIGNSHLRDQLEKLFFEKPRVFSSEFLRNLPKDALASLPMLNLLFEEYGTRSDRIVNNIPELSGFLSVFFSGQVFKKRTDLELFNRFLLACSSSREETARNAIKELLTLSVYFMEESRETKKNFFDITQQLYGLSMLNFAAFIEGVRIVTWQLRLAKHEQTNRTKDEIENEQAKMQQKFESDIQTKIIDERLKLKGIDEETEEGKIQANRFRRKIAKLELDLGKKIVIKETHESLFQNIALVLNNRTIDVFEKQSGLHFSEVQVKSILEKFREPGSIFVYLGKLRESGDKKQQELMKLFLESIVTGTFPEVRYQLFRKHLDVVFASNPNQEKKWKENISYKRMHVSELDSFQSEKRRMKSFLKEAIAHKHIEGDLAKSLDDYLHAEPEERKLIMERINNNMQNLADEGNASEKYEALFVAYQLMKMLELSVSDIKKGSATEFFDLISTFIKSENAFFNDVKAMRGIVDKIQNPKNTESDSSFVTVEETEDPDVLLRMGTDVAGSCQNINGNPSLNRNLISYIMDGKVKTLVIFDQQKTILGRALLRVLFDETEKKPVLHLEHAYHRSGSSTTTNESLLLEIAMKRAEEMGYPLIVASVYGGKEEKSYPNSVKSFGGPGSTEYVDSNRSQEKSGEYVLGGNKFYVKQNG